MFFVTTNPKPAAIDHDRSIATMYCVAHRVSYWLQRTHHSIVLADVLLKPLPLKGGGVGEWESERGKGGEEEGKRKGMAGRGEEGGGGGKRKEGEGREGRGKG